MTASLYVREYGQGDVPTLLIHGLGGSGRTWAKVAQQLGSRRKVLVADLLGFGRSPWPKTSYTVADHLAALELVLKDRGFDTGWMDLAGYSMGAILAAELAARRPERVSGLALVSLPYFRSEAEARAWVTGLGGLARLTLAGRWMGRLACGVMCNLRPLLMLVAPRFAPYLPGAVARDALRHNFTSISLSLQNVVVRHRLDAAFAALGKRPVLFIHGDADRTAPLETVGALVARRSSWKLEVLPGAGHLLPLERPGDLARLLDGGHTSMWGS